MSWMKRAQGGPPSTPRPGPEQLQYNSGQPYGTQQNVYQNYQPGQTVQQQQTWPVQNQQQQYNQQYGQVYQQQAFGNNPNEFYQQYNQNYTNQNYDQMQQATGYQQNYYQNTQPPQPIYSQNVPKNDAWEDNWGWGWDEASKQNQNNVSQAQPPVQAAQEPVLNQNANIIEESFSATDNWNWTMDNRSDIKEQNTSTVPSGSSREKIAAVFASSNQTGANVISNRSQENLNDVRPQSNAEEVKTLNDREVIKEEMPNLALGKRLHLENLTPQWSIESQMSQDSSDGPLTHSEDTHSAQTSENPSRNSGKSSPGPNTETKSFNYSQTLSEVTNQISEFTKSIEQQSLSLNDVKPEINNDLSQSMSAMNISRHDPYEENIDSGASDTFHFMPPTQMPSQSVNQTHSPIPPNTNSNSRQSPMPASSNLKQRQSPMPPPPPVTATIQTPVPPVSIQSVNQPPRSTNPSLPLTSQTSSLPHPNTSMAPPINFPPSTSNPFKHAGPFSHKSNVKLPHNNSLSTAQAPIANAAGLVSPAVVNKVSHERISVGYGANLETTPDNSERPDQPHTGLYRPTSVPQQVPENLEVAPQNDRNEYLQTAHLSGSDYGENTDFSRPPPPGPRRMGVGQQEVEYNQGLNISGEEPPPGLARMVPGQQTESESIYNQSSEAYMDRHIDGQPTDNIVRPYRRVDGQVTSDDYAQLSAGRGGERRPVGLDRMVPGEPSNDEYSQFQNTNYSGSNDQRVVTGVDNDFPVISGGGMSEVREQNVDGSDYTEQNPRTNARNLIGAHEASNNTSPEFNVSLDDHQREITMEGENLQDLSVISSADLSFREHAYDNANVNLDSGIERHEAVSEYQANDSGRQSQNRSSGEDSDGGRGYKASPRKDLDKHKTSRERDRDSRYSRDDRKYERDLERRPADERRSERGERDRRDQKRDGDKPRRDRDESPDTRRHRRSVRSRRYETEDTDYYSDRDRDRRRYREGSYTSSKPPRADDKDRRYDERRRYNTIERERRHEEDRERRRHRDRYERRYRDIDPARKGGTLRRERHDDEKRRGDTYSSGSRAGSREATATDEDPDEPRRPREERRRHRTRPDPAYDEYAGDPYAMQRQQYEYYERLRRSDPAAYMRIYKQIMAGALHQPAYAPHHRYPGYELLGEERGSVHSGHSSANGLKGHDAEVTTDASLNLQLEESTIRSERMTPFKYSTAHIKGSLGAGALVVVRAAYPADGRPAPVRLLPLASLLAADPFTQELNSLPGPLVTGVTHKKSVIEYCKARIKSAEGRGEAQRDVTGYVLVWELLALLLRQNGVVMGSDIAELLMKNTKEYEHRVPSVDSGPSGSLAASSASLNYEEEAADVQITPPPPPPCPAEMESVVDEKQAVEKLRELLVCGSQQEALEWAMNSGLWGHALQLAAYSERRVRASVCARFVSSLAPADPLHTLYATRAARAPPAATCVSEPRWGDWRPHVAILLANPSSKPDQDRKTITQFGDTLAARGLLYSAQFCYLTAGVPFSPHPLAPYSAPTQATPTLPRLSLLLADGKASFLSHFATNQAIFATEIYEYAISLSQEYIINELQVYKFLLATRLAECGECERALRYTEQIGRAVIANANHFPNKFVTALAELAERLKYHDPSFGADVASEEGPGGEDSGQPSPRHHLWIQDVRNIAMAEASQQVTPQHQPQPEPYHHEHNWAEQTLQAQPDYPELQQPHSQETTQLPQQQQDYSQYYQQTDPAAVPASAPDNDYTYGGGAEDYTYGGGDWVRSDGTQYADPYWKGDSTYQYGERARGLRRRGPPAPRAARPSPRPALSAGDSPLFRPLVFGGTYPIDEPCDPPTSEEDDAAAEGPDETERLRDTMRIFETMLARRANMYRRGYRRGGARSPQTFDIDEPLDPTDTPSQAYFRERDARYYVAGPKTFDIDEPFIID
ncbi:unnamed protein product [Leptosia nina]|uniref:Protein transport protein sec16 n=1 Tax=Leptosia nina TaxID=320188 RepID=A0AAV1JIE6_9NEOP